MVETVISQQLSTRAATAIYRRLIEAVGRRTPRPVDVLRLSPNTLKQAGLSRSKIEYIRNVAEAFRSRRVGHRSFKGMTDAEVVDTLTDIKGIGEWSAHMFMIFALGRLDVFPVGDLGLRNAMGRAYRMRRPPSPKRLTQIAEAWRPYRTVGTWYLWESYDNG
jgi:DNA-3-methyladenine glycosylase II